MLTRRRLLQMMGTAFSIGVMPPSQFGGLLTRQDTLAKDLINAIGSQEMGLVVRRLDETQEVDFEIAHNADKLYPVASCFKAFVAYYYFWNTPQESWKVDRDSDVYRVVVYSDNVRTGFVLRDVGAANSVYGNALEKFNDCLLYNLGMTQGMHTWNWESNPLVGITDRRYAPSTTRAINLRGVMHSADNLTVTRDLAIGYTFMAQAAAGNLPVNPRDPYFDRDRAQAAAQATLDLLSISVANYRSPLERAIQGEYIGKDGILPLGDLSVGNVVADAGLVTIGEAQYALSFISVSQSEFAAVNTLRAIVDHLKAFEGVRE